MSQTFSFHLRGYGWQRFLIHAGLLVMGFIVLIYAFAGLTGTSPSLDQALPSSGLAQQPSVAPIQPKLPSGTKVHGLVFYGRWDRVQILDCYLKRNLKTHGGVLDKVIFISNTGEQDDLRALESLLASEPGYARGAVLHPGENKLDFHNIWDGLEKDVLYVKIDDDVVYIAPDAVANLVNTHVQNPQHYITSANVVNNPALSWVHARLGAVRGFVPGVAEEGYEPRTKVKDWRASTLSPIEAGPKRVKAPDKPHRWQRLENPKNLDRTPISKAKYDPWGPGWNDWTLAAQEHYSFFANIEEGEKGMERYKFGTWDMNYERLSINFIAIWGRDVQAAMPIPRDDEQHLTQTISSRLGRHVVVDGKALVAHYSFGAQKEGLDLTDVLERYRSLAREKCGKLLELPPQ